ncbi:RNA-directed DNA polymerase, eukaryota, reverse transcriptase zinc-binding domain protein [Tanacetum coccineum]
MRYPNTISPDQQAVLELNVSKEELKRAVWDSGTNKSPGPDGFTFGFYRRFWKIIENDVFEAVKQFFTHGDIPKCCNSCFIALILNIPDANLVKDFRPISLIGSLYKIIAKILANRLVGVLEDIVNDVDFEKAYDSVRWDFFDDVMRKFGFGDKWCNWIQSCLRSSRGSIIINGSPTKEFQFCKGSKQGDPLSPFLFILIMESLHLSFQRVVDAGMFKGIHSRAGVFYRASGLRINMSKSKIIRVLVESEKVKCAASKLGCLILKTLFVYLGTQVGGSMSRIQAWTEVIDKVKARLSKWKIKVLFIGGRLTLLKSVLGSMPIFHMSIFRVPLGVLRLLESIRSHFFNGHELKSKKSTWVKWNNVLVPKKKRGLGISSLFALNRGLICKWIWKFYTQNTSLWARVIKAVHGKDGKVGEAVPTGRQSCWMDIVGEIKALNKQGINLFDYMRVKVGNGNKIAFWEDTWVGGSVLKDIYPRMYALETYKSVLVGSKLVDTSLDSSFRRKPWGRVEQDQYDALSAQVHDVVLTPMADKWVWSLESSGEFSVASIRKTIDAKRLPKVATKTRWIKYVPIKVNVLAWKIKIDAFPARFNISRRGIEIDSIVCPICSNGVESSSHLFFSCHLVKLLARKITHWWDVP